MPKKLIFFFLISCPNYPSPISYHSRTVGIEKNNFLVSPRKFYQSESELYGSYMIEILKYRTNCIQPINAVLDVDEVMREGPLPFLDVKNLFPLVLWGLHGYNTILSHSYTYLPKWFMGKEEPPTKCVDGRKHARILLRDFRADDGEDLRRYGWAPIVHGSSSASRSSLCSKAFLGTENYRNTLYIQSNAKLPLLPHTPIYICTYTYLLRASIIVLLLLSSSRLPRFHTTLAI